MQLTFRQFEAFLAVAREELSACRDFGDCGPAQRV
jgi:hypothetical protein